MIQNASTFQTPKVLLLQSLRQRMLSIAVEETTFSRRKFRATDLIRQQHLERVGQTFLQGYHTAIQKPEPNVLSFQLNRIKPEWRGFAFEGAAMGLALLDALTPWQSSRLPIFLKGAAFDHLYMGYVGAGWIFGRVPGTLEKHLRSLDLSQSSPKVDPLLGWLAIDGYGFSEGYFRWQHYAKKLASPKHLSGYTGRVFDQGLGRSLWFIEGANVPQISETIGTFPPSRQADLWSGIGLACAYAGGVNQEAIERLTKEAGQYLPQFAQGIAFAAKARQRAKNLTPHVEMVSQTVWGRSADRAAKITDDCLIDLPTEKKEPAYEIWRQRIQIAFKEVKS